MKVTLANITINAVEEIYKAYKICYTKGTQDEIKIPLIPFEGNFVRGMQPDIKKMTDFIVPLMTNGHTSPLEHCNMTFYITGVSRALMAQLTRHRTFSFNIQSQRYVDANNFDFVTPPSIKDIPYAKETYEKHIADCMLSYNIIVNALINSGVDKKKAQEDARFVLPNATTCNITVTCDLHNFRNFYGLRDCVGAQWEIKELAQEMMKQVKEQVPFADINAKRCGRLCNECSK